MRNLFKKSMSTLLMLVVLIQYFSPIFGLINVNAEETINEISPGYTLNYSDKSEIELDFEDNRTKIIELTGEGYIINSCTSSNYFNNNVVSTKVSDDFKQCIITAENYGRSSVNLYISKDDYSFSYNYGFNIDVESDEYFNTVMNNLKDEYYLESGKYYGDVLREVIPSNISFTEKTNEFFENINTVTYNFKYTYRDLDGVDEVIEAEKTIKFIQSDPQKGYQVFNINLGDTFIYNVSLPSTENNEDYVYVSLDNTIASVDQRGNITAKSLGITEIRFYNKNTFEYEKAEVIVQDNNTMTVDDFAALFQGNIVIDASKSQYSKNVDYKSLVTNYFYEQLSFISVPLRHYIGIDYDKTYCVENEETGENNKCKIYINYNNGKEIITKETEFFTIDLKGISVANNLNLTASEHSYIMFHYEKFLGEDDLVTINYDEEYLEFVENENGNGYSLRAKKVGNTLVEFISSKGYYAKIDVNIPYSESDMIEVKETLTSLNVINLPYKSVDFLNNKHYLESIIEEEVLNSVTNVNIKPYLNVNANCLFIDKCIVSTNINTDGYSYYAFTIDVIKIVFDETNNTNDGVISNLISASSSIKSNYLLSVEDTIKVENESNTSEEFYNNLFNYTDLSEVINNSSLDINYKLVESKDFSNGIKGHATYKITFYNDDKSLYSKLVTVSSNHIISMSHLESHNENERIKYIKNYVDGILVGNCSVNSLNDNYYQIINEAKSFNIILDQKDLIKISSINLVKNFVNLNIGETFQIEYNIYPTFANSGEVKFKSTNEEIATVTDDGTVTALSNGYTTIQVKYGYSTHYFLVLINTSINEILNNILSQLDTNIELLYSETDYGMENAISNSLYSRIYNLTNGLNIQSEATYENDKYYIRLFFRNSMNYDDVVYSDKKEVNYIIKGIKINNKNIYLSSGDTYDLELFFSEGDLNNLLIDYSNEDVVSVSKDGVVTALSPGSSYINFRDKYDKYYNYAKVVVDQDIYYNNLIDEVKNETIVLKATDYYPSMSNSNIDYALNSLFNNTLNQYIPIYDIASYMDASCDEVNKTCTLIMRDTYDDYESERREIFNVEFKGVFLEEREIALNENEVYTPRYKTYSNEDVVVESLNQDVCEVQTNGDILAVGTGVCPVQYTLDGVKSYQFFIVNESEIITKFKSEFDKLSSDISIRLDEYLPTFDGDDYKAQSEYDSLYYQEILKPMEDTLDLYPYDFHLNINLKDLVNNKDQVEISLNAYYTLQNEEYFYYSYSFDSIDISRMFNITYEEMTTEEKEFGEKIKANIKDDYELNLLQVMRYQRDGAPFDRLPYYSSVGSDIEEICPTCYYVFDFHAGGGGMGDEGWAVMEGPIVIYDANHNILTSKFASYMVHFDIVIDKLETVEEIIELIKEEVKKAYLEFKNSSSLFRSYSPKMARGYAITTNSDEVNVEVTKEFSEDTQNLYNIKVEELEFKATVGTKTTGDIVYTNSVTGINVSTNILNLKISESADVTYEVLPSNATNKEVRWSSSNENVAVYENGKVIAKGIGNAVITVSSVDGSKNATINVNVTLPTTETNPDDNFNGSNVKKGDINLDGSINMTDLIKLRKYQAGLENLSNEALINADVNQDGRVNMTDIIKLRKYFAGLEDIR